jgi:3-oxoadipate enol-lactonase
MEAQVAPSLTRWFTPAALAADGWGVRYARECVRRGDPVDWAAAALNEFLPAGALDKVET